jgi:polysaccharide pyruvyl transferase WcaK-like protein
MSIIIGSYSLKGLIDMEKTIILRSAWQVVNIGDIAHTPGVLAILEKYMPETEVMLWPSDNFTQEVQEIIQKRFPELKIIKGRIGEDGKASNQELQAALNKSDFLLHGSGPLLVAHEDVAAYVKHMKKPFGVFGITYGGYNESEWCKEILNQAKFIYFRDSVSLEKAKSDGVCSPVMKFGPDGAFATDLRDNLKAKAFLEKNNLEPGKFLCCISRYRYTPFWKVKDVPFDEERHLYNERMKEHDSKDLREAIIQVVRQTNLKVLICPEDMTQMELEKEMLYDKLPMDILPNVVLREKFWLTDEALSVYIQSAGLFGSEMHSPIMCIGNGIPAIVCSWKEQTSKAHMWKDIGLGEWLFDVDKDDDMTGVVQAVMDIAINNQIARQKALEACSRVQKLYEEMIDTLKRTMDDSKL